MTMKFVIEITSLSMYNIQSSKRKSNRRIRFVCCILFLYNAMNTTPSTAIPEVFAEVVAVDSGVGVDVRGVVGETVDVDVAVKAQ